MSEPFASTTAADRWHLQHRKLAALTELLQRAAKAGLYPIRWSLLPAGPVHGQCWDFDMDKRRDSFDDWVEFLGAKRSPAWTSNGGTIHLRAAATITGSHEVAFVLTADLYDETDEGEGA